MLVYNPDRKILIPHNPKCGGISVQTAFENKPGWETFDYTRVCDFQKRTLEVVRGGYDVRDWTVIAIVRHPFDRQVSYWRHSQKAATGDPWRGRRQTFSEFLQNPLNEWPGWYESWKCLKYYRDKNENMEYRLQRMGVYNYWYYGAYDLRVVRLENINRELSEALGEEIKVPRLNYAATAIDAGEVITEDWQRELIRRRYWWAWRFYGFPDEPQTQDDHSARSQKRRALDPRAAV